MIQEEIDKAIQRLQACQKNEDTEWAHMDADRILCDLLLALGIENVVEEYEKVGKWYC